VRHPYRRAAIIVYDGSMDRNWLGIAAINGGLAVMAGAFAAHGLKAHLSADSLAVFETGARYQMYALAMALAALVSAGRAAIAFLGGIVLFSGSLYLLALTGTPILGAITPIGGLCFIAGWGLLAWRAFEGPI
jgi:uncharacterized membrane protein YgdD (TMEM256/DUF423 family)